MKSLLALRSNPPETHFTHSGDVSIAYQVVGDGPPDLVLTPGFLSHLEQNWLYPVAAQFLERLASFSRLIMFDKRGTGLSDRSVGVPSPKERMDDLRAVMDAVGSPRAVLVGISEGGPLSILFAATYPQRASALILYGSVVRTAWAPDFPWGAKPADFENWYAEWKREWGGPANIETWAPSMVANDRFRQWWARYLRLSASPGAVRNLIRMNSKIDVRAMLSAVDIPTLVLHRAGDLEHIYLKLNANRRSDARRMLLAGNRTIAADAFW
jgi:pimeloyl-ACP methyl ester carboxylesterase